MKWNLQFRSDKESVSMNVLKKELEERIKEAEKVNIPRSEKDKYRLRFHLMPPTGWLNDPNGLCQFQGQYHVFFQYTPFDAEGGLKVWGHYRSPDLIQWEYLGVPIVPDQPFDCHGVYSGCAYTEGGLMYLFYTGNVKREGEYDYINEGREAYVVMVTSEDGVHVSSKQCLLGNQDYPGDMTCHVRDPKVLKHQNRYYMVLGARKKGNQGVVLLYQSEDLKAWEMVQELSGKEPLGYMWECPDLFKIDGQWILGISPQGLKREKYRHQNIYQSGYCDLNGSFFGDYTLGEFREWDMGFDFYAPQTFEDERGRRILIGWCGLPDADQEYTNPTTAFGWQHALTVPREVKRKGDRLYSFPVEEIESLRKGKISLLEDNLAVVPDGIFDMVVKQIEGTSFQAKIGSGLVLEWKHQVFCMYFTDDTGKGRGIRRAELKQLQSVRVLADTSLIEVYLNEGEMVFTTRYYPEERQVLVQILCDRCDFCIWNMQ